MKPVFFVPCCICVVISIIFTQTMLAQVSPEKRSEHFHNSYLEHGTFGLALVRKDTITIGMDSRGMGGIGITDTVCKIFDCDGVVCAFAGIYQRYDFNVRDEAKRLLALPIPLDDRIHRLDSVIVTWMSSWIDSAIYRREFLRSPKERNINSIRILFATFVDGTPVLYYHCFFPKVSQSGVTVDKRFNDNPILSTHIGVQPIGGDSAYAVNSINVLTQTGLIWEASPEIIVHDCIRAIATLDVKVGGPVDIVQLTRDGKVRWIQRKENCH